MGRPSEKRLIPSVGKPINKTIYLLSCEPLAVLPKPVEKGI